MNFLAILIIVISASCTSSSLKEIKLEGYWIVKLDSMNIGMDEAWAEKTLDGTQIKLPGTLVDAGLGTKNTFQPAMDNLSGQRDLFKLTKTEWNELLNPLPPNKLVYHYFRKLHNAFKTNAHTNRKYDSAFSEILRFLKIYYLMFLKAIKNTVKVFFIN